MRNARRRQAQPVALALLVACGAPTQTAPIQNQPTSTRAIDPSPDVSSCLAVVNKEYDDGHDEFVDPKTQKKIVVTTSDVCGLVVEPIFFKQNSADVIATSADQMASMLACTAQTERTRFRLEVIGHASADERNPEALGLARAKAVEQYFTACGVPVLGMTAVSAGARQPVLTDDREHARAGNRRVTFLILERTKGQ